MNINITINADTDLLNALQGIAALFSDGVTTKVTKVDAPKKEKEPVKEKSKTEAKKNTSITLSDIRAKFVQIAQSGKRDELKALLDGFGADNVSSLKEEDLEAVYAKLGAL